MEKSTFTSTIDDNQSYDIYEAHNPRIPVFTYNQPYRQEPANTYAQPLAYKNEGFKDNSTFASNSNYQSRAESVQEASIESEETPIIHSTKDNSTSYPPSDYYNMDTLPLSSGTSDSDSTVHTKQKFPEDEKHYASRNLLQELNSKLPVIEDSPSPDISDTHPHYARSTSYPYYNTEPPNGLFDDRPNMMETNFDEPEPKPKTRSKSEALLETNFDYFEPSEPVYNHPLTESSRSKSQPLETAM